MSFVKNLVADLVARKLWPVAAVLVIALVAIPVLLKGGSDEAPPMPAPANDEQTASVVSPAVDAPRQGANPTGRNPFAQQDVSEGGGDTAVPGVTGSTGGGTGTFDGGYSGGVDITGGLGALEDADVIPVGGSDGAPLPKPKATESYRVDLRFGQDGRMSARNDVARLSPLPSAEDPFFVFMGVLADGETALFLVSSDAEATGDGTCKPTPENCERVEMQAGETEFFDVTTPDGAVVQYQLDLVRLARVSSASAAVASAARTRESSDGRTILRQAVDTHQVDVADLAFSRELGVLVPSAATRSNDLGSLFGGFRTDLRFGRPGDLINRYNIARLTPLPSSDDPSFLFMGVIGDPGEEKAFFLNPSDAAASGDAICSPSPADCSRFALGVGDSGMFDVPAIDGTTFEYQLDVTDISPLEGDTPDEARQMRHRESPAGRVVLRRLIHEVGGLVADLNYASDQGKIVRVADAAPAGK